MRFCYILIILNWRLLHFSSCLFSPRISKEKNQYNTEKYMSLPKFNLLSLKNLDKKEISKKLLHDNVKKYIYYPLQFSQINLPRSLYEYEKSSLNPSNLNSPISNGTKYTEVKPVLQKSYNLADLLKASGILENSTFALNKNLTECVCKPLGCGGNLTGLAKCCCSKDMLQKCEGVDLSYLLPIPGDTTTTDTGLSIGITTTPASISSTCCSLCESDCLKSDETRNGRGYRKVEESTLDALRKLQLTHGIFAPNEQEMAKAIQKAKVQLSRVKSKLPEFITNIRQDPVSKGYLNKVPFKDESELYKILPQLKIERIVKNGNSELKTKPQSNIHRNDFSLLSQNAAAIKKQLETIRQYDILLANIRAQAQIKLIELTDMESKSRLEEVRYKKERDRGLQELRNMEEVLRQEIKLAANLPGANRNWAGLREGLDQKLLNTFPSELGYPNKNVYVLDRPHSSEDIREAVNRNTKLLDELNILIHGSDNCKESNVLIKPEQTNFSEDKSPARFTFFDKDFLNEEQNNHKENINELPFEKFGEKSIDRFKRKCETKSIVTKSKSINEYDRALYNLQNDLMDIKTQLMSQSKYSHNLDDNVLVQIKVSVDVGNGTDPTKTSKRELCTTSRTKQIRNKGCFKNASLNSK